MRYRILGLVAAASLLSACPATIFIDDDGNIQFGEPPVPSIEEPEDDEVEQPDAGDTPMDDSPTETQAEADAWDALRALEGQFAECIAEFHTGQGMRGLLDPSLRVPDLSYDAYTEHRGNPNISIDVEDALQCVATLSNYLVSIDCADLYPMFPVDSACRSYLIGSIAPGEACVDSDECTAGNWCPEDHQTGCGMTCTPEKLSGDSCSFVDDRCAAGLTCGMFTGTCRGDLPLGDACDPHQCQQGAVCTSGVCTLRAEISEVCTQHWDCALGLACVDGTCANARNINVGKSCESNGGCAPTFTGLSCVQEAGVGTCQSIVVVDEGGVCDTEWTQTSVQRFCGGKQGLNQCIPTPGSETEGLCANIGYPEEGQACLTAPSLSAQERCADGLRCRGHGLTCVDDICTE